MKTSQKEMLNFVDSVRIDLDELKFTSIRLRRNHSELIRNAAERIESLREQVNSFRNKLMISPERARKISRLCTYAPNPDYPHLRWKILKRCRFPSLETLLLCRSYGGYAVFLDLGIDKSYAVDKYAATFKEALSIYNEMKDKYDTE